MLAVNLQFTPFTSFVTFELWFHCCREVSVMLVVMLCVWCKVFGAGTLSEATDSIIKMLIYI
ncbi:hypothetical protein L195_g048260 [Trifolium pratense]|uniref:Uncharacterized protein n=1 Tax=Trifolium pratense TaxID=57577 RepID=A0A2K3JKS7_TRIPR|nr:hypothetical protein L195_g048260 [Trifolium pratense]